MLEGRSCEIFPQRLKPRFLTRLPARLESSAFKNLGSSMGCKTAIGSNELLATGR